MQVRMILLAPSAPSNISEDRGVAVEQLTNDTSFADIRADSLLSMTIMSRFREELGLNLESRTSPCSPTFLPSLT